mmetsp:Transcript_28591/g.51790  ORF Transcript_28591/g.51790 Transcript_28591/m.51790 type:complete len:173 (+) Transcript_28591:776-1294(+)
MFLLLQTRVCRLLLKDIVSEFLNKKVWRLWHGDIWLQIHKCPSLSTRTIPKRKMKPFHLKMLKVLYTWFLPPVRSRRERSLCCIKKPTPPLWRSTDRSRTNMLEDILSEKRTIDVHLVIQPTNPSTVLRPYHLPPLVRHPHVVKDALVRSLDKSNTKHLVSNLKLVHMHLGS